MLTEFQEVSGAGVPGSLRQEWADLLGRSPGHSFCQTIEYGELSLKRVTRRGGTATIITVREDEKLIGIWPVTIRREGLLRIARPASCGTNEEYSVPLVDPEYAAAAEQAIMAKAVSLPADVLALYNVKDSDGLALTVTNPALAKIPATTGAIPGYSLALSKYATWDAYTATASKSHRKGLRYDLKKLQELGHVEIGECKNATEIFHVLQAAFEAKRRWAQAKHQRVPWLGNDDVLRFFTGLAATMDLAAKPLVSFIKLDGVPIATQINLIGDTTFEYFYTGYDEAYAKYSPGQLLLDYSLQWSQARKLDFDFRILHADYKVKLADTITQYKTHHFLLSQRARVLMPARKALDRVSWRSYRARLKFLDVANDSMAADMIRHAKTLLRGPRRSVRRLRHRFGDALLNIKTLHQGPVVDRDTGQRGYEPMSYPALKIIDDRLPMTPTDVFYDVGSGKGAVVCYFAQKRISEVYGVEIDRQLGNEAFNNIERMRGQKARSVGIHYADATAHDFRDASVIFMYNPFDDTIMRPMLSKIIQSLKEHPRDLRVVYANPVQEKLFAEFPQFKVADRFKVPYDGGKMPVIIWRAA